MKQNESNGAEWNLARALRLLRRRGWIVVVSAIAAGALFLCAAALTIPPRYRAETLLHIHSAGEDGGVSWSELTAAQGLVHTCVALLDSRTVLEEAGEAAGLALPWQQLSAAVRGEPVGDTELLRVIAEDREPEQAAEVANAAAAALARRTGELVAGSRVQVVDPAVVPSSPCAPDYLLAGVIGVIAGGVGALLVLTVCEDRRKIPVTAGKEG